MSFSSAASSSTFGALDSFWPSPHAAKDKSRRTERSDVRALLLCRRRFFCIGALIRDSPDDSQTNANLRAFPCCKTDANADRAGGSLALPLSGPLTYQACALPRTPAREAGHHPYDEQPEPESEQRGQEHARTILLEVTLDRVSHAAPVKR